jgi:uncharacterized protein (TIGR02246 family)
MSRIDGVRTQLPRGWRAALAMLLVCGCAHSAGSRRDAEPDEARAAIAAANVAFSQALVRGDAQAMAAIFAEDGEIIPAMEPGFVTGRAAIAAYQEKRVRARRYLEANITTRGLGVSGDVAWETGTSQVTFQQGESAPVTVTGRYLAVWQRQADGSWRIRAELPVTDPVP